MGYKNKRGSLRKQISDALASKTAFGESKHAAKQDGTAQDHIYSYDTLRAYLKHANYFADFCKTNYHCKTLEDCREHTDDYIRARIDQGVSAYTVKLEAAALRKLYGDRDAVTVETPARLRSDITRSRAETARDRHFSEERNSELVGFCRSTGLRRKELESLRGSQLIEREDGSYAVAVYGKGGRYREAPVIGDAAAVAAVVDRMQAAGDGIVWGRVHSAADIHAYRSDYATAVYKSTARDLDACRASGDVYWCRGDRRGQWFDKAAMLQASRALGHNRISVVGEHYIR